MSRTRSCGELTSVVRAHTLIRYQKRKVFAQVNGVWQYVTEYQTLTSNYPTSSYADTRASITDELAGQGLFNPVLHTKSLPSNVGKSPNYVWTVPGFVTQVNTWDTWKYELVGLTGQGTSPYSWTTSPSSPLPSPNLGLIDWSSLVSTVGSSLDGHMTSSMNILVEICQIAQTIGMLKNPFQLGRLLANKDKFVRPLREIAKGSASKYLELQFGWKPLLADIKAVALIGERIRAHQKFLQETENKYTSSAATQTISETPAWSSVYAGGSGPTWKYRPELVEISTKATFSLDIMRTEALARWSFWDLYLQGLGANDVVGALWDLVPYSFVVDWFVHLDRILKRGPIDWTRYQLRRVGYSTKTEWKVRWHHQCQVTTISYGNSPVQNWYSDPVVVATRYERTPGFPDGTQSSGFFASLSKTQIAEGAALVVQKLL